jgi:glyceraldehyde 3-phosphate dehydrogenase
MINFSINGFGRIGRSATRVWLDKFTEKLNLVAINTSGSMSISGWAHLLKYDTAYGPLPYEISISNEIPPKQTTDENPLIGYLDINKNSKVFHIPILAQREPEKLPWEKYNVEIVIESTGVFRDLDSARRHIDAGAKQVILSAPAKSLPAGRQGETIPTAVIGVNEAEFLHKDHSSTFSVVSNASCTTNSIAPVASLIHGQIGIRKAMLTTIHGYTDDQNLQDNSHKDLRRARAAAHNIIPTSTGAALATTKTIPELQGLFDGVALRVPVITGSITDFTFLTKRGTSVEEINEIFISAVDKPLYKNILAVTNEPMVSSDIIGRPESSIVDLNMTHVVDGDLVKILAWYDNEFGYANRLVEQVLKFGEN